jgi:hypothetical protein
MLGSRMAVPFPSPALIAMPIVSGGGTGLPWTTEAGALFMTVNPTHTNQELHRTQTSLRNLSAQPSQSHWQQPLPVTASGLFPT